MTADAPAEHSPGMGINRREFLYYLGGASLALFSVGTCAVVYQVAQAPANFRTQPGVFELDLKLLQSGLPVFLRERLTYLHRDDDQLTAFSRECPFDKFRVVWVALNNRFECPDCGSKFRSDGTYISGSASRGMDRFVIWVETPHGIRHTPKDGSPVPLGDATQIWVDTRTTIPGQPRA